MGEYLKSRLNDTNLKSILISTVISMLVVVGKSQILSKPIRVIPLPYVQQLQT